MKKLRALSIDRRFLIDRLLPSELASRVESETTGDRSLIAAQVAAFLSRVFGWERNSLLSDSSLELSTAAAASAHFKVSASASTERTAVCAAYAHYLSALVLRCVTVDVKPIPSTPASFRELLGNRSNSLSFASLLEAVWSLGVIVLPLPDKGGFDAGYWRHNGRHVIVLKQRSRFASRWSDALLHELYHAGQEPSLLERSRVELTEDRFGVPSSSSEESDASWFAIDVLLKETANELARECQEEAEKNLRKMKAAVVRVSQRHGVPVGALANYVAYCLSQSGHDWWATATALQPTDVDPYIIAATALWKRIDLSRLKAVDRELLIKGVTFLELGEV